MTQDNQTFLQELADDLDQVIGRWPEAIGEARIDNIYEGIEWSQLYRCDIDPTYHLTAEQSRVMSARSQNCWETFCKENKLGPGTPRSFELTQDQENEYSEYENEWFEPALVRLTLQGDEVFLSINYTDAPYYLYQYDEPILKIERAATVAESIARMKTAYETFKKETPDNA